MTDESRQVLIQLRWELDGIEPEGVGMRLYRIEAILRILLDQELNDSTRKTAR